MSTESQTQHQLFFNLTKWLIDKRYFVVFILLIVIVTGVLSWQKLPLEAFPDVANMQVRVITQMPGKAPEEVERLVTIPIEKEVNGIPHSKPPRSVSISGLSVVTIVFDDSVDPYTARQQVLERIAHADVPDNVEPAIDPNASPVGEIYRYTLGGSHWSPMDKKEVQDWLLNRLFRSVDGIVDSTGFGGPTKVFLVELDPGRLTALGISQSQVAQAIAKSNDSAGGSYIVSNDQRYMVRGLGLLKNVSDIQNVAVTSSDEGIPIRIRDLANVQISSATRKGQVGLNEDDDAVEGVLMMRRGDNPSRVIDNLKENLAEIESELPAGMHLEPLYDRTALVKRTVETISHNVLEGVALVVLILIIFLFQLRSALICAIVIPVAILSACIILRTFNISANLLSLGAIDFGIIVDGAIIMVENITRRLSEHSQPSVATVKETICTAAAEVASPILFGTTIIAMTFLPILSFEHVEGRLFKPLAVMMNLNLVAAFITTLTVIPVICFIVFGKKPLKERESPVVIWLEKTFRSLIPKIQNRSKKVLLCFLGLFLSVLLLVPFLGAEFIPELEEGNLWVTITLLPSSVTLDRSVKTAHEIRAIIKSYPEVKSVLSQIGSPDDGTDPNPINQIEILVDLMPQETWRNTFKTKEDLVSSMDAELNNRIPGLVCNFSQCIKDNMEESMSGVKNGEFAIKIFGPDFNVLESTANQIAKIMSGVRGITDVAHDLLIGQPQLIVEIDREKSARFGVTAEEILDVVETAIGGKSITRVIDQEKRFDIMLRLQEKYRDDPRHVGEILVSTPSGQKIPLRQLAQINLVSGASTILRENNKRRIAVYGNIRNRDLGSAVLETQKKVTAQIHLPPGYTMVYAGEFERAREAGQKLLVVVPVTLVLIFSLLYLAFDSAGLSLLVLGSVPVAAAVAIVVLFITGTHLSVSSGVGLIALFGLSIQNAVIVVSNFKDHLTDGMGATEAIHKAAIEKMNAVIIAALVAAVGLLPAAMATAIGSQSQKPFAIVISMGILPSTLLTLFLLPALAKHLIKNKTNKDDLGASI